MIKISKDNLFLWKLFGIMLLAVHAFFIFVILNINFWVVYLVYLFIFIFQLLIGRVWRYIFISDVYLSESLKEIFFKDLNGNITEFSCDQIEKTSTSFGITDIFINNKGETFKAYLMINSKENLKYLK